ncbi:cytochrome b [Undibacterium macrobrachii]|uniref:Cytochrome b n=1 Tax=Undibacterium macrobrachii TaxID=1119058 RepID=A0ABQ2XFB2_9BURK|nr:cytochrome b [Undibacterium macrobrachii]GGX14256.1 cytochrome b [Undibacterium macrobrachii]
MQRYPTISIVMHWLIAILIIAAFILGSCMTDLRISPTKLKLYSWHKWLGVTILGFVALRLLVRLIKGAPSYPDSMQVWEKQAANAAHIGLYFLMFAVPLSGYLYSYAAGFPVVYLGLFELPALIEPNPEWKDSLKEAHEILTKCMFAIVLLHIGAALKHQFINKDGVLQRMLPTKSNKEST